MEKLHRLLNEAFEHNRPSNKVTFPRTQVQLDEPENSAIDNQRFSHDQKSQLFKCFSFLLGTFVFFTRPQDFHQQSFCLHLSTERENTRDRIVLLCIEVDKVVSQQIFGHPTGASAELLLYCQLLLQLNQSLIIFLTMLSQHSKQ